MGDKRKRLFSHIRLKYALLLLALFLIVLIAGIQRFADYLFPIKEIVFIGNRHLSERELRELSGIGSLRRDKINVSTRAIKANLVRSPWIKNVSIRRELPYTLKIRVYETEPFALLEMKGRPFLIDESGRLLEELRGEAIPFLPVILSDPFRNKESFAEALNLARVLKERDIAKERNRVEIIANREREDISVVIDGVVIKVGYGNYEEKFERLFDLEEEIKRRTTAIEYIDLRFSDNVIVKPVKEVVR